MNEGYRTLNQIEGFWAFDKSTEFRSNDKHDWIGNVFTATSVVVS